MTTFKRIIKKNTPNKYTITEQGYWDYTDTISIDDDTAIDISLTPYTNIASQYKVNSHGVPSFKLNDCTLPNNKNYTTKKYALDKVGYNYALIEDYYYNFKQRGKNIVDATTGLMSNITNADNIGKPFNPQTHQWSITIEIQTPSTYSKKTSIYGAYETIYTMPELYLNADGTLGLCLSSNGSTWDIADNQTSTLTLMTATKYKIVLAYTLGAYTLKVTPQSDYFANEEQTYIEISSSTPIFSDATKHLNIGYSVGSNCFEGNIFLQNTRILIDDTNIEFFAGYLSCAPGILENSLTSASAKNLHIFVKRKNNTLLLDEKMQTKDYMWVGSKTFEAYTFEPLSLGEVYANYETIGELVPTDINFHVGPFSNDNFIKATNINLSWSNNFIAYLTLETGSNITTAQSIFSNAANGSIGIHNGSWKALTNSTVYGKELQPNTLYDIKIVQDVSTLYLYTRVHNDDETNEWELQLTTTPQYASTDTFYLGNNGQNEPFSGKIQLKTVKIEAEESSWIACDEQVLAKPV